MIGNADGMIARIRRLSLKWKLLVPLLLLSFVGTTALVLIGLSSQERLIEREERKEIDWLYRIFSKQMEDKEAQALSLAATVAHSEYARRFLSQRNRVGLVEQFMPVYRELKDQFEIQQFHFHVPPGRSFLRLHRLDQRGEVIAYRRTILNVMKTGRALSGLEWGWSGLGIRGISPVFHKGRLVGSVEIGFPFGRPFLERLKQNWGGDFTVYEIKGGGVYQKLASTVDRNALFPLPEDRIASISQGPVTFIAPERFPEKSVLFGPVADYSGRVVAVVQIDMSRKEITEQLSQARRLMLWVALAGIAGSFVFIWFMAAMFVRPIVEIVRESREIAEGKRESRLEPRPADEIGVLTNSLNTLLESLKDKRVQLEEYARTLERRVQERTADLVSSEEKYRTLVENLPLIVYRIQEDGTAEFVNPYFTEKLGYSPEEVVGDKRFWKEKICGREDLEDSSILEACWDNDLESRVERVVRDKAGEEHTFIDHAIPMRDDEGRLQWIEGIMMDITEYKMLQERAVRTEEIRVMEEISARFAHELRNPLATAGGFARRLHDSLGREDERRKLARIIVDEVARLETLLSIMLSSIEPVTLCVSDVNVNEVLRSQLIKLRPQMEEKGISLMESLSPSIPLVQGDGDLLNRAFENLLANAVASMPGEEKLLVSSTAEGEMVLIELRHPMEGFSEEDVDQFFLPRVTGRGDNTVQDLPLSKIIIHRHGGKIVVSKDRNDVLLRVELPTRQDHPWLRVW